MHSHLNAPEVVQTLRRLLSQRDHRGFVETFVEPWVVAAARRNSFLRALAGEGLCLLISESPRASRALLSRYAELLLEGLASAPAEIVSEAARRLDSKQLDNLAKKIATEERALGRRATSAPPAANTASGPVFQVRRIVQTLHLQFDSAKDFDALGSLRSVYRSPQERSFMKALSLRFPGLLALPNYPLDQFVDLSRLRELFGEKFWRYGRQCRLDAVLVIPSEGDPVAAFELDSAFHDDVSARSRDRMKNEILRVVGLPFYRLRVESPGSMTSDEWYALLTDQVVPILDVGQRIRCREAAYSLVPI